MPTVLRIEGFRLYFYSHEPNEPAHVHIGAASAKVWLEPVALARNLGFRANELTRIMALVRDHQAQLLEAWDGHFGRSR